MIVTPFVIVATRRMKDPKTTNEMQKDCRLEEQRILSELFASNFCLLYANRERIWSDRRLYGADVGVAPYGSNGKVGLGAVLYAIDAHPNLFHSGSARIIDFYGSPLSGTTVNKAVDLQTGRVSSFGGGGFIAKVRALNRATELYPMSGEAASLTEIIGLLSMK